LATSLAELVRIPQPANLRPPRTHVNEDLFRLAHFDEVYHLVYVAAFSTFAFPSSRVASSQAISCSSDQSAIWQQV
jgi:hypothetical protein